MATEGQKFDRERFEATPEFKAVKYPVKQTNRTNKEIVQEINAPAAPSAGARRPEGKPDDCDDSLNLRHIVKQNQKEFDAKASKTQSARKSAAPQIVDTAIPRKKTKKSL